MLEGHLMIILMRRDILGRLVCMGSVLDRMIVTVQLVVLRVIYLWAISVENLVCLQVTRSLQVTWSLQGTMSLNVTRSLQVARSSHITWGLNVLC